MRPSSQQLLGIVRSARNERQVKERAEQAQKERLQKALEDKQQQQARADLEYIRQDINATVDYVLNFVALLAAKGFMRTVLAIPIHSCHYTTWDGLRDLPHANDCRNYGKWIAKSALIAVSVLEKMGFDIKLRQAYTNFDGNHIAGWFDVDWSTLDEIRDFDVDRYLDTLSDQ